jgi:hypothetical protein
MNTLIFQKTGGFIFEKKLKEKKKYRMWVADRIFLSKKT